ncbi:hypothetical protein ACIBL6_41090 [Streptomyces sp. NPDC050400]|uniref:hypothetical protein n=1 Tax=Streptomyces sp. NPDC050400 TaxID=3365610 RepID=UPI003790FB4E
MTKQLTTQNAMITTASVEVQTLTISGKQVTLAVFRQLQEEPLIADDGTLNGDPWGIVNYHPDKCASDDHWHIVWQRDAELRRCAVSKIPEFDPTERRHATARFEPDAADRWLASQTLEFLQGRIAEPPVKIPAYSGERVTEEVRLGNSLGFPVVGYIPQKAMKAIVAKGEVEQRAKYLKSDFVDVQNKYEAAQQELATAITELAAQVSAWGTPEELLVELRQAGQQEVERRERHRATRATLAELPQLFIAV